MADVSSKTEATLRSKHQTLSIGSETFLYLTLEHEEGWYSYYFNNLVPDTIRPVLKIKPIEGVEFGRMEYSLPEVKVSYDIPSYVYKGVSHFRVPIKIGSKITAPQEVKISAVASWQICKNSCLNESANLEVLLRIGSESVLTPGIDWSAIETQFPKKDASITAQFTGDSILLESKTRLKSPQFFDYDGQTQFGATPIEATYDKGFSYKITMDKGNELREEVIPVQKKLRGILVDQSGQKLWLDTAIGGFETSEGFKTLDGTKESVSTSLIIPHEDELSKLYDASHPIPFRTLKKTAPPTFWIAISGAFLGGILLNLMPCVFPVLSLKVLSFVEKSGSDPWKVRLHGLLFTFGVMLSMWVLVSVLFALKASSGNSFSWGQQMGDPRFVGAIIIVLFLFGLNMAGIFEFGTKLTSVGQSKETKNEYVSTIFSGVLTTIIATPCSGPFLGAAMGYTFEQPLPIALFIFTVFSLGISLPYLLLSFFPKFTSRLPRPGSWMVHLKQILSFGMFAAAAFFMQTYGAQVGAKGLSWLVMALVVMGLAFYCYGVWSPPYIKRLRRYLFGFGLPAVILYVGLVFAWRSAHQTVLTSVEPTSEKTSQVDWVEWKPGIVEHLRGQGKYVWVDYTATWCATCFFNKKRIFSDEEFLEKIKKGNIVFVKADLTDNSPIIAKDLSRVSRVQIPVNLVYNPDNLSEAILLEELISPKQAVKALELTAY